MRPLGERGSVYGGEREATDKRKLSEKGDGVRMIG
jgi:hypothetical protein